MRLSALRWAELYCMKEKREKLELTRYLQTNLNAVLSSVITTDENFLA